MTSKQEKRAITVTTAILSVLAVIALFTIVAWAIIAIAKLEPVTSAQAYVNTVTNADGKEKYFMELEYWENADGKGKEVFEFSFNGYTDVENKAVLGKGVQFVSGELRQGLKSLVSQMPTVLNDLLQGTLIGWDVESYDYDEQNSTSWVSLDEIGFGDRMYVSIGDEYYKVAMDGTYTRTEQSFNFSKSFVNFFKCLFTDINGFNHDENWYDTHAYVHQYTMTQFYCEILNSMIHTNAGYGSTVCNLVDLGKYFSVFALNENGAEVEVTDKVINNVFFAVKVTKHYEGLRRASDSSFGQLLGDANYSTVDSDNYFNDYSSTEILPTLTASAFDYYTLSSGGYVAKIKQSVLDTLHESKIHEIVVDINVNDNYFNGNRDFVGIMASSFNGLKLKAMRIGLYQSTEKITFTIYESNDFKVLTGLSIDDIEVHAAGRYSENVKVVENIFGFYPGNEETV